MKYNACLIEVPVFPPFSVLSSTFQIKIPPSFKTLDNSFAIASNFSLFQQSLHVLLYVLKLSYGGDVTIKSIDEVSADDLFVLDFTDKITTEKEVTDTEADRFSNLVEKMFGKPIIAVVFDEMIKQWEADLQMDRAKKEDAFDAFNEAQTTYDRCVRLEKAGDATEEDLAEMRKLKEKLPKLEAAHSDLQKAIGHRQDYIEAAEGMLRVYEGDESLAEVVGDGFQMKLQDLIGDFKLNVLSITILNVCINIIRL